MRIHVCIYGSSLCLFFAVCLDEIKMNIKINLRQRLELHKIALNYSHKDCSDSSSLEHIRRIILSNNFPSVCMLRFEFN